MPGVTRNLVRSHPPAQKLFSDDRAASVVAPDVVKDGSSVDWWSKAATTASEQALWKAD